MKRGKKIQGAEINSKMTVLDIIIEIARYGTLETA